MRVAKFLTLAGVVAFLAFGIVDRSLLPGGARVLALAAEETPTVAVAPQYDTAHVYVAPDDLKRFVASLLATFGGSASNAAVVSILPTPSSCVWQAVRTPVGNLSVFGFETPVPYPFGAERTGYLVTDMDVAIGAARAAGADVVVAPFKDPIGRDAVIQFPGGVNTQLYWHTTAPSSPPLQTIPENRVYVSADRVDQFTRSFLTFSRGKIVSDEAHAPGVEIGRPAESYRRIRMESNFGKMVVLVTDGHLPYPYGRETTGYEVADLADILGKAKAAGAAILIAPYSAEQRNAALIQFPGGYIAEIHSRAK